MKRFLYLALCLIIACAMTLCFVACGDETPDSSTTSSSADNTTSSTSGTGASSTDDTTSSTDTPAPPAHEHTYDDVLSYDENEHYYAANCEHADEKKDVEAHTFNKITGFCVCGYYIEPSVEGAIEEILANRGSVTSGTLTTEAHNVSLNSKANAVYSYAFYENYVYIKEESDYVNEYYYAIDKNGQVFGVTVQGNFVNRDDAAYEDSMNGPLLNFTLIGDDESIAYGIEDFIAVLFEKAQENVNGDFVSAYVDGMFAFGYGVRVYDEWMNYFYVVSVAFSANAETGTLGECAIVVQKYAQETYTMVEDVVVLNENATPSIVTTYTAAHSTDAVEETENPYDPNTIVVDSFVVRDTQGNDIEETIIRVEAGGQIKILFTDITPETALFKLCSTGVQIINNEDDTTPGFYPYFNAFDNSYTFTIREPGSYTMTVFVDDIEVVTTIEVALMVPTTIATQVYDREMGAFNKTSKATVYAGAPLYLMSYVESDYDGAYIAELVGDATGATLTNGEINGIACTLFKAETAGTYTVAVKSTVKDGLSANLTITVEEAPTLEAILSGEYIGKNQYGMTPITVTFDSDNKTAEVVFADSIDTFTATVSYTTENGFAYELSSGDDFIDDFYISDSYELVLVVFDEIYVLEAVAKEIIATGTMVVEDVINNGKNNGTYVFELEANGKFTFYKDGVATTEVALRNDGTSYMFKFPSVGFENALTKTSGSADDLAGAYEVMHSGFGLLANVTITVDAEEKPVKQSTTGTLVVEHLDNNGKYSGTYTYEIVDGAFVFYKDGEVTADVTLTGSNGDYMFKFKGVGSAQALEKTSGIEGELGGTYKCSMQLGATAYHVANVTITPDPVVEDEEEGELTTGTLVVEDNNSGAVAGTYTYAIVDGAFVFYKNGAVTTDIMVTINLDGTYSFQSISLMVPQVLVKVEGEEGVLAGKYNVNFIMDGIFVLTFTPGEVELPKEEEKPVSGTIEIKDNNTGSATGTYTFEIVDGVFVIYKDGEVTGDVIINIGVDGNYTFQCAGLKNPQTLVKVEGEDGVLDGKYNVNFIMEGIYVVTITTGEGDNGGDDGDDGDDPVVGNTELVLGDNAINVPAGGWGVDVPFTSAEGGKFTISAAAGETNAAVTIFLADGTAEMVTLPYTFEIAAGETITFNICPDNYQADTINLVVAVANEAPAGPVVYQGTHAGSGRLYQVTIDAAAGTMSVIRAAMAGNSLNTANGAVECVYTYSFDGTTVTYELVSGSGCKEVAFDANGAPIKVLWSTHEVTNFEVVG